jgi:hypothetical protein
MIKLFTEIGRWLLDSKNQVILLILLLLGMGIYTNKKLNEINDLSNDNIRLTHNILALSDTIRTRVTESGLLVAEKSALQMDKELLSVVNNELYKRIEELQTQVTSLQNTVIRVKTDTIYDIPTAAKYLGSSRFLLQWSDSQKGNWGQRTISGENRFTVLGDTMLVELQTTITNHTLQMSIQTGYSVLPDGRLNVFASTNFPNATIIALDGVIIDPASYVTQPNPIKRSRWGLGIHTGIGLNPSGTFPYIGVGIHYSIFNFNR